MVGGKCSKSYGGGKYMNHQHGAGSGEKHSGGAYGKPVIFTIAPGDNKKDLDANLNSNTSSLQLQSKMWWW